MREPATIFVNEYKSIYGFIHKTADDAIAKAEKGAIRTAVEFKEVIK